jgi:hypothetical protein
MKGGPTVRIERLATGSADSGAAAEGVGEAPQLPPS